MKGKLVKIDVSATAKKLLGKWLADLKRVGGHKGHTEINVGDENNAEIIIETDIGLWLADTMTTDLSKVKYAKVTGVTQYPGHFDWKADTYIKDAVVLHFSMHPTF